MIVFLKTGEEHLQCLHIVLNHFRECNLRLKATKCKFFENEINYLAHYVSREGVQPSKDNLKAVVEFTLPWNHMGHYWSFIKGFAHIGQPLHEHLSGEGASKKKEHITLTDEALDTFEMLMKSCLGVSVLAFADFNKPFLLETDTSKPGLGAVLSQKQADGWYCLVVHASWSLTGHEHSCHSTKQRFLAFKWVIVEQFQEYLGWMPFVVKTDNNHLPTSWLCPT